MGTTLKPIDVLGARFRSTSFPAVVKANGTNIPVGGLAFAKGEYAFYAFRLTGYGSGNITVTFQWYADNASSGDVVLGASLAAITANTDTQDVETDSLATENTVTDTHLGTTGQRLHEAAVVISNLDSVANFDFVQLRFGRVNSGSDTMSGDLIVVALTLSYSDT